jgi:adenylate cyclase
MLIYAGRAEEAVPLLERAIRLDPFHPPNYLEWLGHAYFRVGRYEDCTRAAKRGLALNPDFVALHFVLAECAYGLGDKAMARKAGSEILRTNPGFTIGAFADYVPFRSREDFKREIEGLRFAGLPE